MAGQQQARHHRQTDPRARENGTERKCRMITVALEPFEETLAGMYAEVHRAA